jgi:hypothetical protein
MPTERPAPSRLLAQLGVAASAFAVFTCGWLAMKSDDWKVMLGLTVLAGLAGVVAQAFSRRLRGGRS